MWKISLRPSPQPTAHLEAGDRCCCSLGPRGVLVLTCGGGGAGVVPPPHLSGHPVRGGGGSLGLYSLPPSGAAGQSPSWLPGPAGGGVGQRLLPQHGRPAWILPLMGSSSPVAAAQALGEEAVGRAGVPPRRLAHADPVSTVGGQSPGPHEESSLRSAVAVRGSLFPRRVVEGPRGVCTGH